MKTNLMSTLVLSTFLCVGCANTDAITKDVSAVATADTKSIVIDPKLFDHCKKPLPLIEGKSPDDVKSNYEAWTTIYVDCAAYFKALSTVVQKAFRLDENGNPLK